MSSTIDKAGRLVIPAHIRVRAGLMPGTEVEIQVDDLGIRLVRTAPRPKLVRRGKTKRLVARPTAPSASRAAVDVAEIVDEERNRWPWQDGIIGGRVYDLHIAEAARAAGAELVLTENRRHCSSLLRYGIRVQTAADFLESLDTDQQTAGNKNADDKRRS